MLKQGAQKGGPKGENKWLKHQSDRAGTIQMHLATFHGNSKYQRKCLYFGSNFRSLWVPVSGLLPKSDPRGPRPGPRVVKVHPNRAQGCQNAPPEVPKSTKKTSKCTPRVANWRPKVPQWSPKVTQSITKTPQALQSATTTPKYAPRCQKTSKHTQTKTTNQPTK